MKNLRTSVLCVCVTLYSLCSAAQAPKIPINEPDYNKPMLFSTWPETIPVSMDNLNSLVNTKTGLNISTNLSTASFQGKVVSDASKYDNKIQSVVIRSTNYNGATLTISRITNDDGSVTYTGRLVSFQHGDLYVLQQKDGGFALVKKNYYDVINE